MPTASSALNSMRKYLYRAATFNFLALSFFLNPLSVSNVEADYLKVTAPAEIFQSSQFEIAVEISAKPSTNYSAKVRLGATTNQLTKGQTLDTSSGVWLSDSVSWDRFPRFQTDTDGHWSGHLQAKTGSTATTGANLLVVRLNNSSDGSTKD